MSRCHAAGRKQASPAPSCNIASDDATLKDLSCGLVQQAQSGKEASEQQAAAKQAPSSIFGGALPAGTDRLERPRGRMQVHSWLQIRVRRSYDGSAVVGFGLWKHMWNSAPASMMHTTLHHSICLSAYYQKCSAAASSHGHQRLGQHDGRLRAAGHGGRCNTPAPACPASCLRPLPLCMLQNPKCKPTC